MFTSFWQGKRSEPVPAGFRIKTTKDTYKFGDTNTTAMDTWLGKGRIIGVTLDVSGNADFMQFHLANNKTWWPKEKLFDSPLERPEMSKEKTTDAEGHNLWWVLPMSHGSTNYMRGFIWVFMSIITIFSATMWDPMDTYMTALSTVTI